MSQQPECHRCSSTGWVCEDHPDKPWETEDETACGCGGAGAPCPDCNTGLPPRFIAGSEIIWTTQDGWAN